ncbi:MFS transporter [Microbacterium sp.]|uniref:MFS transporter n=1 Tax=Microbacterium sp. TaxID=51671 RepID=UPI003222074B
MSASPPETPTRPPTRRLEVTDVIVVEKSKMRTALTGAFVGNFMEWYDFGIYGYLAITMHHVFLSGFGESLGLTLALLGFAVSFLVRPLGGLILGPIGDKVGRQKVLYFTMAIMAAATALIGMLPTADQLEGWWGPGTGVWVIVPLYLLKMLQGFSTGGEFAGASTYVAEFSPDRSRGFWASMLNMGSYLGFAAGASVVALTTVLLGNDVLVDWGWRIPFLIALPLGAVAIWFRMRIPETPSFEVAAETEDDYTDPRDPRVRHGLGGLVRYYWKAILIGIAIVAAEGAAGYALTSYMPTYLENEVGVSNLQAAVATIPVLVVMSLCLPFIGKLSDRIGRKPVYFIAVGSTLLFMVPAFAILQIGEEWAVFLALSMVAVPVAFYVSMTASALPALFPTPSRFGGMGLTYNIAASLFGGTTPLFANLLVDATGNKFMPAFYIMFFAAIAAIALFAMKESGKRPLLGSVPTVTSREEAQRLVDTQDDNPFIDTSTMPLPVLAGGK